MFTRRIGIAFVTLIIVLAATISAAQEAPDKPKADESESAAVEEIVESSHHVVIDGHRIDYTTLAGTLPLKTGVDDPKASIFFIAYAKTGDTRPPDRPVTFSFNGGPGSSSVWLHLGLLGPRRVLLQADGSAPPPPYRLVDNEYSVLDKTDLVFIDPVSTGYSRTVPEADPKGFHGVHEDIESVGEFIRLYLTRYQRWASPKFLIGESYGTVRAAGLANYLQDRHGMYLNGIMLISSILQFQTAEFEPGNDLPYVLFLPTYTATAWYHGQLADDLQGDLATALSEAEAFAENDYATALLKGDKLSSDEADDIVRHLARLTGLGEDYIRQTNMRIQIWRFVKELLRDQRRTVGRLDTRFRGIDADAAGEAYQYDPSYAEVYGPYSTLFNDYVRRELEFKSDLPYEILTGRVYPWKFSDESGGYVNMAEPLRRAMTANPALKVFIASGHFDLATPYFATDYTVNHLGLDPTLRGNITMAYYEAGHMMYIHRESLGKMRRDLVAFLRAASGPPEN